MPKCQFTTRYKHYEIDKWIDRWVDFNCPELPLVSGRCIFHDKDYLQDQINNDEHKWTILNRLKRKVTYAISDNEPLLCIGFQLPDFSLSDLIIRKEFTKPVYFDDSRFYGKADFDEANFQGEIDFPIANFQGRADFYRSEFYDKTYFSGEFNGETTFHYVLFEGKEKVIFDVENLSNVSFMNTDLTGVKFSDKARWGNVEYDKFWGGKKATEGKF